MKLKKLMMATAIVGSGVLASFGEETKSAQLYDIKITVKTTVAKTGKLSPRSNPFVDEEGTVVYRVQSSRKWTGVAWGCDCNAISGEWKVINDLGGSVAGCVIWDSKSPYDILFMDNITWRLLNAIDAKGSKCEACWTIGNSSDVSKAFLAFSGFGTLSLADGCLSYAKNLTGNVAGWMPGPASVTKGKPVVCTFCGISDPGSSDSYETARAWDYCPCDELGDSDNTAVFGTWSMKYNASLSKKLSEKASILDVYKKFPESVKTRVAAKIAETLNAK